MRRGGGPRRHRTAAAGQARDGAGARPVVGARRLVGQVVGRGEHRRGSQRRPRDGLRLACPDGARLACDQFTVVRSKAAQARWGPRTNGLAGLITAGSGGLVGASQVQVTHSLDQLIDTADAVVLGRVVAVEADDWLAGLVRRSAASAARRRTRS